jgi:hypothetical protein
MNSKGKAFVFVFLYIQRIARGGFYFCINDNGGQKI